MNKNKNKNKSMSGKKGTVGAPEKQVHWPARPFTLNMLVSRNANQCKLSLIKKIEKALKKETLVALQARKQPHRQVGRPSLVYVLRQNYDPKTMKTLSGKVLKVVKARIQSKKVRIRKVNTKSIQLNDVPVVQITETPAKENVEQGVALAA